MTLKRLSCEVGDAVKRVKSEVVLKETFLAACYRRDLHQVGETSQ